MDNKPKIFIGSSSESLEFVDKLELELKHDAITRPWHRTFRLGSYTLDELVRESTEVDMAAFILGREDTIVARSKKSKSPRDNVIYEAGLFTGRIGMSNVFLIVDQNGTKMPTDMKGLTYTTYNSKKHDTDEAVRLAAIEIRNEIKSWSKRQEQNLENQVCGYWFQYVLNNDDGAVVSLMNIYRDKDQSTICLSGKSWTADCKMIAEYKSQGVALNKHDNKLFYYWEGSHPFDKNIEEFYGVGEITFSVGEGNIYDVANGWFSQSSLFHKDNLQKKSFQLRRAQEDLYMKILSGKNKMVLSAIKLLIKQRNSI